MHFVTVLNESVYLIHLKMKYDLQIYTSVSLCLANHDLAKRVLFSSKIIIGNTVISMNWIFTRQIEISVLESGPIDTSVIHSASSCSAPFFDSNISSRSKRRPWTNLLFLAISLSKMKARCRTFLCPVYWS